jgi:hypothetical protein
MPAAEAASLAVGREMSWLYRAFGLTWRSTFRWPTADIEERRTPDVSLRLYEDVDSLWSGHAGDPDWLFRIDDRRFVIQNGVAGDFRLVQPHGARFHLDASARLISCAPEVESDAASQRLLLDTVLWTTMFLHGFDALHASAVETPTGVVAFLSSTGGGKTSLALELLRRGNQLFSDDIVAVERRDGEILVHSSPPLMNVPSTTPLNGLDAEPVATIGDESWISISNAGSGPSRLRHLVLLNRAAGLDLRLEPVAPTARDLLPFAPAHAFVESWQRRRFEICSDLALTVPVSRLEAGLDSSPSEIADLVQSALGDMDGE